MKTTTRKLAGKQIVPIIFVLIGVTVVVTIVELVIASFSASTNTANAKALPSHQVRFVSLTSGTTPTSEVPTVLPQGGVTVNNQFVLLPLSAAQNGAIVISSGQAITIGRQYANAQPFSATTLLASFTSIDSVPPPGVTASNAHVIQNVPVWIVTFTTNNPQNVVIGKKGTSPQSPTHFNIAINANTGAFVEGFFTA